MLDVFLWNTGTSSILGSFPDSLKIIRGFLQCSVNQTEDTMSKWTFIHPTRIHLKYYQTTKPQESDYP